MGLAASDLAALGITNQRETTVVWNKKTGRPYCNAIVWQDTRTDRIASALEREGKGDVSRQKAGLPPATYFSGGKIQWILENVPGVRADAEAGDALFGNTDSWVMWNLTGGVNGGVHVTDVSNASRTMLMSLETLDWDDELLGFFNIPRAMLPQIRPSSDPARYGEVAAPQGYAGIPPAYPCGAATSPYRAGSEDGLICGNIARGMLKKPSSSSSQSRVSRLINMVRLALLTSVTWTPPLTPPVRFHITQLSVFPNRASPASASARTPSTCSSIHWILPPEK